MILFNELRITEDNKYLIIDVEVSSDSYYKNVTIKEIKIDTDLSFNCTGPSQHSYNVDINLQDSKHIRVKVGLKELQSMNEYFTDFITNMLFVYVIVTGKPAPETPCGLDKEYEMRTVVNLYTIYTHAMGYLRELSQSCVIPKNYINMFLQFKAIDLCIKTGNYMKAIELWHIFIQNKGTITTINTCGCNG